MTHVVFRAIHLSLKCKKILFVWLFALSCFLATSQPANIVFEGDSNTEGAGTTPGNTYPEQTMQLIAGNFNLVNLGIGGFTSGDILGYAPAKYPGVINVNSTFVLLAGINDIQQHKNGNSIFNNIEGIVNYVKSLGCYRIIVGTYPAYTGILTSDNNFRLQLNSSIRNNAAVLGYTVADHAVSAQLSSWSSTYYSDYIHFNNLGAGILASNTKDAFNKLPNGCQYDVTPPVIVPKNITLYLGNTGRASITPSDVVQSFTDNCGVNVSSLQIDQSTFTCANIINQHSSVKTQALIASSAVGNQPFQGEAGSEFSVSNPGGIIISQLGAFDHLGNGITGTQSGGVRVAIFNKNTRTIVPGLDEIIVGNADEFNGNHRLKNISPVTLLPGNYAIVAKGYNSGELLGNGLSGFPVSGNVNTGNGSISFTSSLYGDDYASGFRFPKYNFTQSPNIFAAGTFTFKPVLGNVVSISGTDQNGNSKQAKANVIVLNSPSLSIINCPENIVMECNDALCLPEVNWTPPSVAGNCNQNIQMVSSHQPGDVFPEGTTLVTYTFTGNNAQQAVCSFTVTINKMQPALPLEAVITNVQDVVCPQQNNGSATATVTSGNQGYTYTWSTVPAQYTATATNLAPGNYSVTITDDRNQAINLPVAIKATDKVPPAITGCPADIVVSCSGPTCAKIVNWVPPVAQDNCTANVTVTSSHQPGATFANGTTVVNYNFSDANGNQSTCSFSVTVNSIASSPVQAQVSSINHASCINGNDGSATVSVSGGDPAYTFEWNTNPVKTTQTANNLPPGNYLVTVKDSKNQSVTIPVTIGVLDNIPPVIPTNVNVYLDENGQGQITKANIKHLVTDNCGIDESSITVSTNQFSCPSQIIIPPVISYQAYTSPVTIGNQAWKGEMGLEFEVKNSKGVLIKQLGAFDHQGNGIQGTQQGGIRVAIFSKATNAIIPGLDVIISGNADAYSGNYRMKNISPVTLLPGSYVLVAKGYNNNEMNGNFLVGNHPAYILNDGNGAINFIKSYYGDDNPAGFKFPQYPYTPSAFVFLAGSMQFENIDGPGSPANNSVNITAKDNSGNSTTVNALVTILDTVKPKLILKSNVSLVLNNAGKVNVLANDIIQSVTDNCAIDSIHISPSTFTCDNISVGNIVTNPDYVAYSTTSTVGNQAWKGELGMEFSVKNSTGIIIKQLGAFDHNGDGINGSQQGGIRVAVFNKATRTIVPGLEVIIKGMGDAFVDNHRMVNVTPVTLMPGNYVLVAKGYYANELNGNKNIGMGSHYKLNDGNGAIEFVESLYSDDKSSGFGYPQYTYPPSQNVFLAGTMCFTTPVSDQPVVSTPATNNMQAYSSSSTKGNQSWRGELGMEFSVNNPAGIVINQMGAFDHNSNGITGTQNGGVRVAIYNKATKTIVPGLDVNIVGAADPLIGNHRMKTVSPVILPVGNYVIVAKGYNANELNGNKNAGSNLVFSLNDGSGAISFIESSYGNDNSNGFAYPLYRYTPSPNVFLAGSFIYDLPGNAIPQAQKNFVTVTVFDKSGNVTRDSIQVNVEDPLGICNSASKTPIPVSKIPDSFLETKDISIYPNPSNGLFNLQLVNPTGSRISVVVFNLQGKAILQKEIPVTTNSFKMNIPFDLSGYASGIYIIKVRSAGKVQTVKLVINR